MCDICKCAVCPPACPSYVGDGTECSLCGHIFAVREERIEGSGRSICLDCVGSMDVDELLDLCLCTTPVEILAEHGYVLTQG